MVKRTAENLDLNGGVTLTRRCHDAFRTGGWCRQGAGGLASDGAAPFRQYIGGVAGVRNSLFLGPYRGTMADCFGSKPRRGRRPRRRKP